MRAGPQRRLSTKNLCFQIVVLDKTLGSPLESMEFKPVNPKRNQPWVFFGRTKATAPRHCHLLWRANSLEKTLMLGMIEQRKRSRWQRITCLDGFIDSTGISLSKLWKMVKDGEVWCATVYGVTKSWTQLRDWTTTNMKYDIYWHGTKWVILFNWGFKTWNISL